MSRVQLADSHLTYIGAPRRAEWMARTAYDVYRRDGGLQLGVVERDRTIWRAVDFQGEEKIADARWKACVALWPVKP